MLQRGSGLLYYGYNPKIFFTHTNPTFLLKSIPLLNFKISFQSSVSATLVFLYRPFIFPL